MKFLKKINDRKIINPVKYFFKSLFLPGKGTFQSGTQYGSEFVQPAFDNQSNANYSFTM